MDSACGTPIIICMHNVWINIVQRRRTKYQPPLPKLNPIADFDQFGRVRGIAQREDILLVLKANRFAIYNRSTFDELHSIQFNETSSLHDLVVCPNGECAYFSDLDSKEFYKVDLSTMNCTMIRTVDCVSPHKLSVSRHNNLLVVCSNRSIQVYSPAGSLIRTLPTICQSPSHAVEQDNQTIVVGCSDDLYQMSSQDGQFIRKYGTPPSNSGRWSPDAYRYGMSLKLAVDEQGYVLAASENGFAIFNPSLTEGRNLERPFYVNRRDIWLDESRGRLFVSSQTRDDRVQVIYEVTSSLSDAFING